MSTPLGTSQTVTDALSGHGRIVCRCGAVIAQCRCPDNTHVSRVILHCPQCSTPDRSSVDEHTTDEHGGDCDTVDRDLDDDDLAEEDLGDWDSEDEDEEDDPDDDDD